MKKTFAITVLCLFLAACTGGKSDEVGVQTRVAQLLTSFPTPSTMPTIITTIPQPVTPTPEFTATLAELTATDTLMPIATETLVVSVSTATSEPTTGGTPASTPTVTATYIAGDPRLALGNPTWKDTMDASPNWPTGTDEFSSIAFSNGEMVLTSLSKYYAWRIAGTPILNDIYLEMTGKFDACSGEDSFGIYFRVPVYNVPVQGYLFGITCKGEYFFKIWDGKASPEGQMTTAVYPKTNSAIIAGANQSNRIGVLMKGSNLKLYLNGTMVNELADSAYSQGFFGVFIKKEVTDKLTVRITEMDYWLIQ